MEKPIIAKLNIRGATPADHFIFFMGVVVVLWVVSLMRRIKRMEEKYHVLDKENVRLWDRLYPNEMKDHHSGDYHHPPNRESILN
jgi:hypothetical protein